MGRLTAEQVASTVAAAIQGGTSREDFAALHPDWDQADLAAVWTEMQAEIAEKNLTSGQSWAVGSEW